MTQKLEAVPTSTKVLDCWLAYLSQLSMLSQAERQEFIRTMSLLQNPVWVVDEARAFADRQTAFRPGDIIERKP